MATLSCWQIFMGCLSIISFAGQSARFSVRIRYRQPLQGARLFVRDEGAYLVFDRPQRGITPGQFAAWYDGDQLVGSGVIEG